jgi:hypothetical protein
MDLSFTTVFHTSSGRHRREEVLVRKVRLDTKASSLLQAAGVKFLWAVSHDDLFARVEPEMFLSRLHNVSYFQTDCSSQECIKYRIYSVWKWVLYLSTIVGIMVLSVD